MIALDSEIGISDVVHKKRHNDKEEEVRRSVTLHVVCIRNIKTKG